CLVPRGWVMDPAAADQRRHDLRLEVFDRIAVEDDEVGEVARDQLAAAALVSCQPGWIDRRRFEGLLDGQALLGMPRVAVVDRPADSGADAGERVELLDWRIGAVCEKGARLQE